MFILSFRHRDELLEAASRGGWFPIAARRAGGVERRFIDSGAALAIVDGRGAFDEAIGAIRTLADPVEANSAALVVLLSRGDVARLGEVHAAGATHYLASPFGEAELLQALRFAARYARRLGGGPISRPALSRAEGMRWSFGPDGLTLSVALNRRYGLGDEPLSLRCAYRLLGPGDRRAARAARLRLKAGYASTAFSHLLPDGSRVAHHLMASAGEVNGLLEPLDRERVLPLHRDPLTGLPDGTAARRWLSSQLTGDGRPGVLLIGVSRLPVINSLYGRGGGDALLQAAARRIERVAREVCAGAWVARLAGTEFMVGLPRADAAQLGDAAERIVAAVERRVAVAPDAVLMGADVGGAIAREEDPSALLRRVSAALAEAREASGSAIRLLDGGGAEAAERAQQLATDLRGAMAEGQIEILFQPQVRIGDGVIEGVEALARWRHPLFGELGAEALFGAAQRADLVAPLSELVQRCALDAAAAWPKPLDGLRLSLNVTAADLARADFAEHMLAAIDASGFARDRVTAEVTEEGLIEDLGTAAAALARLRQGGCRVAVDDFGTGYSSLAYLKALPLDYLKLDRRLSQDIAGSARGRVVVRSVIDMARALGLGVIAEGVETEEQLALLAAEGCTLYQGFLCSGPVGVAELVNLVGA
ncbi:EAL domain-containing protein [Sphingomonas sp. MAH-20]|uniref:EAL domain-containing protein n=1 Tax=Sphingomonas horti TaxID=2682842 RepID=A0A6I4J1Z7_9SPHN|nr:bifunctional diguanylate cyclase/phosphodiesterase [Sphingomonas sp. CGMCC 1.13658]MVO78455.1 EAL domain-containing protein [Sphingomonas horti]